MMIIFCTAFLFTFGRCADDQSFVTKTVCVGEDVTLTCSRLSEAGFLFWIRLVAGNFPEILAATYTFDNGNVKTKAPRVTAKQEPGTFALYITKAELSDTAFYYCQQLVELRTTFLNKTFLKVQGPEPDITAVTQDFPSDPVRPGDSVTLQCSVVSEDKTCPGEHSVFWFRAGSEQSHPSLIYAHGDSGECEESPEASQKCVYSFSKNVSASDAGTYYCAVATCGEIFYGNGTKLDLEASNMWFGDCQRDNTTQILLCVALALSLIVIALLIYTIKKKQHSNALQTLAATTTGGQQSETTEEDSLVYSVPNFSRRKAGRSVKRGANSVEGETIYSGVMV